MRPKHGGDVKPDEIRNLVVNRKARHDYFIEDVFEAGISLLGSEVKSLRAGQGNLQEAFIRLDGKGAVLQGFHISPYLQANINNHDPLRHRRLLLRQPELAKLKKKTAEKGRTIVPLRVYLKGSLVKVEIALATGKKNYDKRQALKEKTAKAEMRRRR